MPELPEVARTALSLNQMIKGVSITEVNIHSGRYIRHGGPTGLDRFREELPAIVDEVTFFGKLILFKFTGKSGKPWWAWNTLGMSGGWRSKHSKHGHIELKTRDYSVFFTDARNFGTMKFIDDSEQTKKKILSIGPNHLSDQISDKLFKARLMKYPYATMAEVLMNQSLIGGIGNYIKAEMLYQAEVSPHRLVNTISNSEWTRLNQATEEVVKAAFADRGASISTYKDIDGEEGDYGFSFKVYGRRNCQQGYQVIKELTKDGRMTHWVPQIQK